MRLACSFEHADRAMAAGKGVVPKSHNGWVEGPRALTVARSIHVSTMTGVANAVGSLPVSAPEQVRAKYGPLKGAGLYGKLGACGPSAEDNVVGPLLASLKALVGTWLGSNETAGRPESAMRRLIEASAPALLQVKGCGTVNAAELAITAGDNPERNRNDAKFASICGESPISGHDVLRSPGAGRSGPRCIGFPYSSVHVRMNMGGVRMKLIFKEEK